MRCWYVPLISLLCACLPCVLRGQSPFWDQLNPLDPSGSGIRITDVTLASSYFSESSGQLSRLGAAYGGPTGTSAMMLQGTATLGWSRMREDSGLTVTYTPSYVREFRLTKYSSINQNLAVTASRKLASKLSLNGSFQALMSDFKQLLFSPSAYGNLASSSGTFDDLVAAMLTGQSSNPAMSQLLALAPVNGSPQTAFFYGGRQLSTAGSITLLYPRSSRSSFHSTLQWMRTEFSNAGSSGVTLQSPVLAPATTTATGSVGWSYLLTPRTTAAIDAGASRSLSRYEDAYTTQFTGTLGRTLNQHWFLQALFGVGRYMPVRQSFGVQQGSEPEIGGSVGYKFKAETLITSYMRIVSDSYGLGAYETQSGTGAWNWSRPGSSIAASAGFGYSRLTGPGFPTTISWTGHAGISRRLQSQLFATATYSYVQYPQALLFRAPDMALSGVMVGLNWSPSPVRR